MVSARDIVARIITPKEIQILHQACVAAGVDASKIQPDNPFKKSGGTAQLLQAAVGEMTLDRLPGGVLALVMAASSGSIHIKDWTCGRVMVGSTVQYELITEFSTSYYVFWCTSVQML